VSKVLVTGATGFLGGHLTQRLNALGYDVYAVGRNLEQGVELSKQGIRFIPASFEDRNAMLKACKDKDYVFHCGALSSNWGKHSDYYNSNVVGTKNIIEGCEQNNVKRLIHVSTPSIYFCFNEGLNVTEDTAFPRKMVNDYALTKYLGEQEIDKAFTKGLPVITIRPRAIFGEGDNALMPRLIRVNQTGGIPLFNGGRCIIDITYVENVVDSLLLCMNTGCENLGQKYNITNGEPMALIEILDKVFKGLGVPFNKRNLPYVPLLRLAGVLEWTHRYFLKYKEPVLTKYSVSVLAKSQTLNIDKAKKELGYIPSVSVEEGIERYINWYKAPVN